MAKGSLRVNGIIVDADGEIKASTGDAIVVREDDGSAVITVDTGGRALIGSSFTADTIAGITAGLQVEGIADASTSMSIFRNSNDTAGPQLTLGKSRGGAVGADTIIQDNDNVGSLRFAAADGVNRVSTIAQIDALVGGTPGAGDTPGELLFATCADGAQGTTERMRILANGNVGIGTSAPASLLHVEGTMQVGKDDYGHDVIFYGATSGRYMHWDETENALRMMDSTRIDLGTPTGGDSQIYSDGTDTNFKVVTGALNLATLTSGIAVNIGHTTSEVTINDNLLITGKINSSVRVGEDDLGYDVTFYGNSASSNLNWNAGNDMLNLNDAQLKLDQDDNVVALNIDSEATTAHVIDIAGSTVSTGSVINVSTAGNNLTTGHLLELYLTGPTSSITTGGIATFLSDSTDTTAINLVNIDNQSADATGAVGLRIRQNSTGDMFQCVDSSTTVFVIDDEGKVGIGTTAPGAGLHVAGSHTTTSDPTSALTLIIQNTSDTDNAYSTLMWKDAQGNDAACISAKHTDHSGNTCDLTFWTRDGSGVLNRMHIKDNGKVGIGTSAPEGDLHIYNGSAGTISYQAEADNFIIESSGDTGLSFACPDANNIHIYFANASDDVAASIGWDYNGDTNGLFTFGTEKAGGQMRFRTADGTEAMRIDATGNVGIGSTTPGQKLDVVGSEIRLTNSAINTPTFNMKNSDGDNIILNVFQRTNAGGNIFGQARGGLQYLAFNPNGIGVVGTANAKDLVLGTNDTERVRITSAGLVGIGTTAPDDLFHVYKGASGAAPHADSAVNIENGGDVALQFLTPATNTQAIYFGDPAHTNDGGIIYNQNSTYMAFRTNDAEKMRIIANGNLGIGSTVPAYKLDVAGTVGITGVLTPLGSIDSLTTTNTNLVSNGEFETNTTGWAAFQGSITRSNTQARIGSYSLKCSVSSNQNPGGKTSVTTVIGRSYRISGWMFGATAGDTETMLGGIGVNTSSTLGLSQLDKESFIPLATDKWTHVDKIFTATATTMHFSFSMSADTPNEESHVYIDSVTCMLTSKVHPFEIVGTGNATLDIVDTTAAEDKTFGDQFGAIAFRSYDTDYPSGAYIKAKHLRAGTGHGASDMGLVFGVSGLNSSVVNPNGITYVTPHDAMVIDNLGYVGIGTDVPGNLFHVWKTGANLYAEIESATNHAAGMIYKNNQSEWQTYVRATTGHYVFYNGSGANVQISPAGKVGIGTASPGEKLTVYDGYIKAEATNAAFYSQYNYIQFDAYHGGDANDGWTNTVHNTNTSTNGCYSRWRADLNGSITEHFRIAKNGDLTATDTIIGSNSDERLKENINDYTYSIDTFKKYQPKIFDWKNPQHHGFKEQQLGFLAQDLELFDTRWVNEIDLDEDNLDYPLVTDGMSKTSKLGQTDAMYISVINQLITRIEALETA